MRIGHITSTFMASFTQWDMASRIAFCLSILLLIPSGYVATSGPEDARTPATIGVMGSIIAAQAIFMWANRGMVAPYTGAQRAYLAGDFKAARAILEAMRESGSASVNTLTLLGNTYRQLGMVDESAEVLYEAVNNYPNHYFPLYGFARTLLVAGRYGESIDLFHRALENGAYDVIRFDLAEAYYRERDLEKARHNLEQAREFVVEEPHRILMANFWLSRMGASSPPTVNQIEAGLPYWEAQAERFEESAYGDAVEADLRALRALRLED